MNALIPAKAIYALTCVALCVSVAAQEMPSATPSVEYTFDACDGTDDSGNGNTAGLGGINWRCSKGAQGSHALGFDGGTNYTSTATSAWFTPGTAFSYSLWMKPEFPGGTVYQKAFDNEDQRMYLDSAGHIGVKFSPCFGGAMQWTTGTVPTNGSKFTHVALSFDGLNLKFYLNGKLDSTITGGACQVPTGRGSFNMGTGVNGWYRGFLDDLRFYQVVLSAGDIQKIYKGGGKKGSPAIAGSAPWGTSHTVNCKNLSQGTSVDIPATTEGGWNCEDAGLVVSKGDEVEVTIDGTKK